MKRLSDYQGEEALELWADLLEPMTEIIGDDEIQKVIKSGKPKITVVKDILKLHKKEATEIMLRIDPEPIDGVGVITRLLGIVSDFMQNAELRSFFGFAVQEKTESESSGSATENTEGAEN